MSQKAKSILEGVEGKNSLLAECFGNYWTKTGAREYLQGEQVLATDYWERVYIKILRNYRDGEDACSDKNWRFKPISRIGRGNKSDEKILEKAIAREEETRKCEVKKWANQVPAASGLVSSLRDRHRNVDLIHCLGRGGYEFIELKIGSDNPVYAAVEVLKYGLLYILYREKVPGEKWGSESDPGLLNATRIHLKVVAPKNYYEAYDRRQIKTFGKKCSETIQRFTGRRIKGLKMDFCFEFFAFNEQPAHRLLEKRKPL